jgi:hypothetical protein
MQATIVSLLPYKLSGASTLKPGLFPSEYTIPAAYKDAPGIAVINNGQRGVYLDSERGTELVIVPGEVIARSIVDDYIISQPGQDQTCGPGLFFVEGAHKVEEILKGFKDQVEAAATRQKNWWKILVRLADDTWQQSHIIAQIGDLDRMACRQLGLTRDWLDDSPDTIFNCPLCNTVLSTTSAICYACKVILKPEVVQKYQFINDGPLMARNNPVQTLNAKG